MDGIEHKTFLSDINPTMLHVKSPGLNSEAVWFVNQSLLQTGTVGSDPTGITTLSHRHPEWTLWHRDFIEQHFNQMQTCTHRDREIGYFNLEQLAC